MSTPRLAGLLLCAALVATACVAPEDVLTSPPADAAASGGAGGNTGGGAGSGGNGVGGAGGSACDPPTLTYQSFGKSFMDTYCNHCHGFTTQTSVQQQASVISSYAGTSTYMPAGPPYPTAAERMELTTWLACGAP
jgi:hypothetical protein